MEPSLLAILDGKNHACSNTLVSKRILEDRLLDCKFHDAIRRDATANFLPFLQEKVEFTEHNDPGSMELEVRADVYIFSPEEIKHITRSVEFDLKAERARSKMLEGQLQSQMELLVSVASTSIPPPMIMLEGPSYRKGVEDGEKSMQKRLDEALGACMKHADRARELEAGKKASDRLAQGYRDRIEDLVRSAGEKNKRLAELEEKLVYAGVHCTALASDIKYTLNKK